MADILCPTCGKPNPEALEICQFCGGFLKRTATEPLEPLRPGDMPTRKATSDLERTLPGWLRDIRKGDLPEPTPSRPASMQRESVVPPVSPAPPPRQEPPKRKESQSALDFLSGLSQSDEEEESVPDWMAGLKSSLSAAPAPTPAPEQEPTDWLADLTAESAPQQPAEPETSLDWGFNAVPSAEFEPEEEPAPGETPDWLSALKAQDAGIQAIEAAPAEAAFEGDISTGGDIPDWLSGLESGALPAQTPSPAAQPIPEPAPAPGFGAPPAAPAEDIPDWLSGLAQDSTISTGEQPVESASTENQSFGGDLPDWLSG
ncbi:MAG: hypothetical protein EHM81_06390, partial [Chloroflexi bacterium]